ncbi:cytochrome-c peroxidase [Pedobacter hartonius]|uniref:Cytochrome c peroxidase n=1 Tax=Pedobacter hartonius TaxID=425514 RepID=A0A1H4HBL6_9SPHI|nr:cytochrome c peroxidase [Pedobacter hartonius]SEB19213.1 cytochrome c peroxidase [Pedobacter hartonius]
MFQNKVKIFIVTSLWLTILCIVLGLKTGNSSIGVANAIDGFKTGTAAFNSSGRELKTAVSLLSARDSSTLINARLALKRSRTDYKRIEFFMDYFFESSSLIYNRPAKTEVDEPYMEYQEPSGFQVMEAMLFGEDPFAQQAALLEQADLISSSAADLNALLYGFEGTDQEVLESVRLALIKVITLSITGYDAPELKSGIEESWQSVAAIRQVLQPYLKSGIAAGQQSSPTNSRPGIQPETLSKTIAETLAYLKAHPDFDSFNRMEFLTGYALPLQEQLGGFIAALNLDVNHKSALNYQAKNIFSPDAIPPGAFGGAAAKNDLKAALGKRLFRETALSGNLQRSCASCHREQQYFSDGLKTSLAFDGKNFVQRNAPTLLYAGFQYAQFWDGRVKNLQEQIRTVIANPLEMNGNHAVVITGLQQDSAYRKEFLKAFPDSAGNPVSMTNLSDALAAFIRGLAPRNSAFDQYIAGNKTAIDAEQVKGFNLFMGKAQCGSCHFAPLFNGLIPPLYKRTEYEILGTPANDDFDRPQHDQDQGRFGFFPIEYYKAAFKTPTVRNAAMTAPYMHNGVFKDLEKVVEFYNQGGGAGLHMEQPQQTLSAKPLHLSDDEMHQIVVFMRSLTDKIDQ